MCYLSDGRCPCNVSADGGQSSNKAWDASPAIQRCRQEDLRMAGRLQTRLGGPRPDCDWTLRTRDITGRLLATANYKTSLNQRSRSDRPRVRRAELRRCRWPRSRHAARLATLAYSWRRHRGNPLYTAINQRKNQGWRSVGNVVSQFKYQICASPCRVTEYTLFLAIMCTHDDVHKSGSA